MGDWELTIGLYPGILLGIRTYQSAGIVVTCIIFTFCRHMFRDI
jgi:hypothetical protein